MLALKNHVDVIKPIWIEIDYLTYFEQEIIIEIFIPEIPKAKLKIEYNVHPKESDEILATGFTVHAFMNTSGRPIKAPAFIVEKIKKQMKVWWRHRSPFLLQLFSF